MSGTKPVTTTPGSIAEEGDRRGHIPPDDPELRVRHRGLDEWEHLAGEELRGVGVRRVPHHPGEDDPRRPLADLWNGREIRAVHRNRNGDEPAGPVVRPHPCLVRGRDRDHQVEPPGVRALEAPVSPGFPPAREALPERARRPGPSLVDEGPHVVHHEHARGRPGHVVDPARAIRLHDDERVPGSVRQGLDEGAGDVPELQILDQGVRRIPAPVADEVVQRLRDSPRAPRPVRARRRSWEVRLRAPPEEEPHAGLEETGCLLGLLLGVEQGHEADLRRPAGQMRRVQVLVPGPARKHGQVAVQDEQPHDPVTLRSSRGRPPAGSCAEGGAGSARPTWSMNLQRPSFRSTA